MDQRNPPSSSRGTFLSILFGILMVLGLTLFAVVILSPFLAQIIGGVVVVGLMVSSGYLHYWLWGRSLSQQVEGECEEEELRARAPDWHGDGPPRRRF
jgi:hypothetical protein